jgi:hypothetical protein
MHEEVITLGNNMSPPMVDMETSQDIYNCVRTEEFDIAIFNALLMSVVTYLDAHDVDYGDKALPWAESVVEV